MNFDITIFTTGTKKIKIDDFKNKLRIIFPFMQVMSDTDPSDSTTRWFVSVLPEETGEDDTMHDSEMLVLDVTNDASLANSSAKMLLFDLSAAEKDRDNVKIINTLKNTKQSFFFSMQTGGGEALKKLTVAISAYLVKYGKGLLYEAITEEYFNIGNFKSFAERIAGENAGQYLNLCKQL